MLKFRGIDIMMEKQRNEQSFDSKLCYANTITSDIIATSTVRTL